MALPRLYGDLAHLWRSFSPPEHYEDEMGCYARWLEQQGPVSTILELGCGGGHLAHWFPKRWTATLVDLSPQMLALSQDLNPRHEHVVGDMRQLRLERTFDAVLLHDAVMYMTSREALSAALQTAAAHLRPGGVLLALPDAVAETFEDQTIAGGTDEGKHPVRALEWRWDPDPEDETFEVDFAFLVRRPDGSTEVHHDRHTHGLFSRQTWLSLLREAGFTPVPIEEMFEMDLGVAFLCRRT